MSTAKELLNYRRNIEREEQVAQLGAPLPLSKGGDQILSKGGGQITTASRRDLSLKGEQYVATLCTRTESSTHELFTRLRTNAPIFLSFDDHMRIRVC